MCAGEQEPKDRAVVGFGKQSVKDRDNTLIIAVSQLATLKTCTITCRRSSKSRAAIFFISEMFAEKRLIPSLPKDGTCLKLTANV
jgi:hypothetical protein